MMRTPMHRLLTHNFFAITDRYGCSSNTTHTNEGSEFLGRFIQAFISLANEQSIKVDIYSDLKMQGKHVNAAIQSPNTLVTFETICLDDENQRNAILLEKCLARLNCQPVAEQTHQQPLNNAYSVVLFCSQIADQLTTREEWLYNELITGKISAKHWHIDARFSPQLSNEKGVRFYYMAVHKHAPPNQRLYSNQHCTD